MEATIKPLEVWGGFECTVVRVGDTFRDEIAETGHRDRLDDLDRIAELGIRTLRYPVLLETIAPDDPETCDWRWHDRRLGRLRDLGIRPIAGLIHHGSGPRYTNLLDPVFPDLVARHAARVAERYPWLDRFTPVNEPLTTARFSALYGHWYPHAQDHAAFLRALVIQCRAVLLSMQAIRRTIPSAQLVQTEDMGKTFGTPLLRYQADYENERRWLSFDLLYGRVDRRHPWWRILVDNGVPERDLDQFLDGEGAPDIIGINHYLTSERFLDQRRNRYPAHLWGGNGQHTYADAEAVRMDHLPEAEIGPKARLRETWERYGRPIAVTEAHHGCTRDEQLRWLVEVWQAAQDLKGEGADVRAVTVWSLLGAVDWNTLLTQRQGVYEPGAFDIRGDTPRPTVLARAAAGLAQGGRFDHPALDRPGWWHREDRLYRPGRQGNRGRTARFPRSILIAGTGTVGQAFARMCRVRGLDHVVTSRREMDIADPAGVEAALGRYRPWAVVNAAGVPLTHDEADRERLLRANAEGAAVLAAACARLGLPLVTLSSDRVFDGTSERPYLEHDPVGPVCSFGWSKAEAERQIRAVHPDALVLRSGPVFSAWNDGDVLIRLLRDLAAGRETRMQSDWIVSPTYAPDLVHAALDLLIDGESGIWHLANPGAVSHRDLARRLAFFAGFGGDEDPGPAEPPSRNHALASRHGPILPDLDHALARFVHDCAPAWRETPAVAAE